MRRKLALAFLFCPILFPIRLFPQLSPSATWAAQAPGAYQVLSNVTYHVASGQELKLDIYRRRDTTALQPTLIFMHGGFWAAGSKESSVMALIPWLEMGWNVVNVQYRLARVAPAPAAVEDCLCALRYVAAQAKTHNIDTARIVVSGESAGGHLALSTAFIPESAGLDRQCAGPVPVPRPAAVVNWYGVTDVADVVDGPNRAGLAMQWLGSLPNREEIARRVSPLTYVRAGLPPVLTIHGDADTVVPYQHAVRLHEALSKVGVANQLLTIPAGKHGGFTPEERTKIFATIREFLSKNGLTQSEESR
jgi:acetyl esterase/lipase